MASMAVRCGPRHAGRMMPKPPAEGAVRSLVRPFIMLDLTATHPEGDDVSDSMPGSTPGDGFMVWR